MIDWKRRAMQLGQAIDDGDFEQAIRLAAGLRQLEGLEVKTREAQIAHHVNQDKDQREPLYDAYIGFVRLTNETAERLDQEGIDDGT